MYSLGCLSLSFPAHEASLLSKAKLRATGERWVVGTVLMTSFEPLDLAMPEARRPLHFPIRGTNKGFYVFWFKLICSLSLVLEGVLASQGINGSYKEKTRKCGSIISPV